MHLSMIRIGEKDTSFAMEIWFVSNARLMVELAAPNRKSTQQVYPTINDCRRFRYIFYGSTCIQNLIRLLHHLEMAPSLTVTAYNQIENKILTESSRGYSRNGQIKPNITTPGYQISCPVPGN